MRHLTLSAITAAIALSASMAAQASDGTINFSGALQSSTCTVSAASASQTVTLPTLATSTLAAAGAKAGNTPFAISVTGCTAGSTSTAYFETNANVDTTTGRLKNTGVAGNVQLLLTNSDGSTIDLSKATGAQGVLATAITAGAAKSEFAVQYYATGATTPGLVTSNVTFSMVYQ